MPEKVTKKEAIIRQTIEQLRLVKQLIQQENEVNLPYDDDMEEVKVKRPKAENDKTKIENNKDTHSGYGKAGETTQFKKSIPVTNAKSWDDVSRNAESKANENKPNIDGLPQEVWVMVSKKAKEYAKDGRLFDNQQVMALVKYAFKMWELGYKELK